MGPLLEKLKKDGNKFHGNEFPWSEMTWTNGIIVALMRLLQKHQALTLPADSELKL
jgi:hypothetical protein